MSQELHAHSQLSFMSGGGEMGALIRAHNWHATPLGHPETWPQPLKTSLRLLLSTGHPMFIWWGEELTQFYNDAYRRSIGPERHPSALGQSGQACWAEIWPIIEPQITKVLAGKGHTWNENQLVPITRNGKREDVYWTYSYGPIDDPQSSTGVGGVLVVCSETTEQVLAEQTMKAAEARWRSLFDQTPSFMCVLQGPEHRFEYANRNYLKVLGIHDILGKTVAEVVPEVVAQGFIALLDGVYQSGQSHHGVAAPLYLGSSLIYLDFIYQPILTAEGEVSGIFVEGNDVTERVLASKSLQEEHRRKDEFLAMLAHELRNPLAPIRNVSEMLTQSAQQEPKLQHLGSLLARQVTHLTHLMDDLLDISRISQDRITLQLETLSISKIVNMALESLQCAIALKKHKVKLIDSVQPIFVNGDMTRLVQCLTNVLNNAVKYTPNDGEITIQIATNADMTDITVTDNGCGISPDMQSKVFELFIQAKQTLDRSQGGLGIGLNIVQRLVQMHGGNVTVSSEGLGCGSCFCISLPTVNAPQQVKKQPDNYQNITRRILVVDDNKDSADTMSELLKYQGHSVATVYTAQHALDVIDDFAAEIILLDIGLPDMNGYEVARHILSKNKKLVLVALTGYGQAEDVRKAKEVGFDFHFTKPVNFADLSRVFSTSFSSEGP
ncbi:ATP-binding protein [Paraglaciecola sp.]|uniref:hybrid sensor histidine kinase/response regulator n=1 Tax=Paraglaciecola sp. TaxID=1920173 RepID=UPI0030F4588B